MRLTIGTWSALVAAILVLLSGLNLFATTQRILPPARLRSAATRDSVTRHEERMAPVRRALERRGVRGTIGYLTDVPGSELAGNHGRMEQYFLTQFALVPCVLEANPDACTWIVTNLHRTTLAERAPAGFRVAEDFGHGVALLEKIER